MKTRPILSTACLVLTLCLAFAPSAPAESLVDDSGRTITFDRPFSRIISLYGAHTENLFALGLDEAIIGVTRNESHPPAALTKKTFSYRADPERFIAVRPDLVLIRPMIYNGHRSLVDRLEQAGITVVSLQPRTVGRMLDYWQTLGRLTGREAEARAMAVRFRDRLSELMAQTADVADKDRPKVYFEAIHSRMKTFAPGAMALFALEAAGGINLARDARAVRGTNIAAYGKERIMALGPLIDVFVAQVGPMNQVDVNRIKSEPGFKAIKAVREGRVYLIDEKLVSRPTLRLLEGIETLGHILYPDRFK